MRTQEAWGCLAFREGPCRISPECWQLAIALSKPRTLEAGSSEASGPSPGTSTLPTSERYTPRSLICLSLNHLIPSFPVEQMQREKPQCIILKFYLTPPQVEGKLISSISHFLQDVDKIGWGGVCESTFTTVRCWTLEGLQLRGRCHEGPGTVPHWGFPPISNTWLFPWVEHEENWSGSSVLRSLLSPNTNLQVLESHSVRWDAPWKHLRTEMNWVNS